jgi:hypothetical protein
MQGTVRSERSLYADEWFDLRLAGVELQDRRRTGQRLIRLAASAGAVIIDTRQRALLIWRRRFTTGLWGWEMPTGRLARAGSRPQPQRARLRKRSAGGQRALSGGLHPAGSSGFPSRARADSEAGNRQHLDNRRAPAPCSPPLARRGRQMMTLLPCRILGPSPAWPRSLDILPRPPSGPAVGRNESCGERPFSFLRNGAGREAEA